MSSISVHIVDHPLAQARLIELRDERTSDPAFRLALAQLSTLLIYEAFAKADVQQRTIQTPVGPGHGLVLARKPLFVPILRSGLGMLDAALQLVPEAQTGFVGLARNEETAVADRYLVSLPEDLAGRPVFVLDPMLATGGSMIQTLDVLADYGATDITAVCVVGAAEGISALEASPHYVKLVTAAVDSHLNEDAYIVPGLGDAGDRQFGPR